MHSAYADERGGTGYKLGSGSSPRFVLVVLIPSSPESLLDKITEARRQLLKPETYEFHYSKSDEAVRKAFFEAIASERMHVWVAAIHKQSAPPELQEQGKAGLYVHAIAGLALRPPLALGKTRLYLDTKGKHKEFMQTLKSGINCRPNRQCGGMSALPENKPLRLAGDTGRPRTEARRFIGGEKRLPVLDVADGRLL